MFAASTSRAFLTALLVAGTALCLEARQAWSQEYPTRPVTIVVPLAPGGGADFITRMLAEGLSKSLPQRFLVENKPGANGNIGNAAVARVTPDGYTLLSAYSGFHVTNPTIYPNPGWDPIKDFEPIALIARAPHVIVAKKHLPVGNLREFIEHAKKNPNRLTFASTGIGSISQIGGEQLMQATGIKLTHVPYRGAAPAMNDLLGGNVDISILTPASAMGNLAAGSIKALGLAADKRHPMLPNVPTAAEQSIPGIDLTVWFAVYAPAGTPKPIVSRLATEIEKVVASQTFRERLLEQGAYAEYLGPKALAELTRKDLDYWAPILKAANIKVE